MPACLIPDTARWARTKSLPECELRVPDVDVVLLNAPDSVDAAKDFVDHDEDA